MPSGRRPAPPAGTGSMTDQLPPAGSERLAARRVDRAVGRLLAGRRPSPTAADAEELDAIRAATRLAGARAGYPGLSARFRRRLAARLGAQRGPAPSMSRRAAIAATFAAAGGAALGGAAEEVAIGVTSGRRPPAEVRPGPSAARWVDVGFAFEELHDGIPVRVDAGGVAAFAVRRGDRITAVSAICTHQPCTLAWRGGEGVLACPCHGATFATDGRSLTRRYRLPALPRVEARITAGRVEVLGT